MVEMLANVQAPVGGIVINDKSSSSMERYGYYGRSYATYDYYAEDEESQAELSRKRKQKVWWKRLFRG
jgi:hypothetical protein